MPIIKRATYDFIPDLKWVDVGVNPVNCVGIMGAGLALAFKEYCPEMYVSYRAVCIEGKLKMGNLHVFYNEKDKTTIINLPTKAHYLDRSNIEDIELGIKALIRYLEKYPLYTVLLPMLGAGLGRLDQALVYQLFEKYLDPLPNIIFVCMRPDTFEKPPTYVVVGGSRAYNNVNRVELGIGDGLVYFGLNRNQIDAIVSGGARGVDSIACGTGKPEDTFDNYAKVHGIKPIVCLSDWDRYGKSAGFIRNKTMLEIGTHFVLFIGSRSVGTRMMLDLIERHNKDADKLLEENPEIELPPTKAKKHIFIHDISKESQ